MVAEESDNALSISVILPIRNEAEDITTTLSALAHQTLPRRQYEIVVADGDSTDETVDLVLAFSSQVESSGLKVRLLRNPQGIAAAGLNVAIAATSAPILVRVDGHTVVAPDYLKSVLLALEESGADCVGGLQSPQSENPWGRAYAWSTSGFVGSGGASFRTAQEGQFVDTVYLGAWPRKTFATFGDFDVSLGRNQDDEHNMRIRASGGEVYLDPKIQSHYRPRESARALWQQYFGYGLWKPAVLKRHPGGVRLRHALPPAIVLWFLIVGVGAVFIDSWAAALFFASLGIYLVSLILLATITVVRHRSLLLLPYVFLTDLILLMAYGSGFLFGLCSRKGIGIRHQDESQRNRDTYARRDAKPAETTVVQDFLDQGRRQVRGALLKGKVAPTDKILDLGCGRGDWLVVLRDLGVAESELSGIDLSKSRLRDAQARLPRATFHQGCASSLPLGDATFDGVVISLVFSSIHDDTLIRQILTESWRILRPGAWLLVHDMRWRKPMGHTRKFPSASLEDLMGPRRYAITVKSLTLIPPLIRATIHWAPWLTSWLESFSCLRSHWMARIDKESK